MHAVAAFFASIITFVSGFFAPTVASNSPVDVRATQPAAAAAAQAEIEGNPFNDPAAASAIAAAAAVAPEPVPSPPPAQTVINQPVVERIIERIIPQGAASVSTETLTAILADFEQSISSRIAALDPPKAAIPEQVAATGNAIGAFFPAAQRIDQITNATINSPTITGGTISGANVSGYLPLSGGALSGTLSGTDLNLSGNLTAGTLSVAGLSSGGALFAPYFSATSTTATSTFGGALGIGTTTPGSLLSLGGIANFTTATSTFYSTGGINLAAGCFAIAGNCLSMSNIAGTLGVSQGGTGSTTLSGLLKGNGTGAAQSAIGGVDYEFPLTFSAPLSRGANSISLSTSGDWSGTLGGYSAVQLIATGFSTTSADEWKTARSFFATSSTDFWLTTKTTDNLAQGSTNKYYATSLFAADLAATTTSALSEGSNLYYTANRVAGVIAGTTTDALAEGSSRLYFTNARADARINATTTIGTLTSAPNLATLSTSLTGFLKATAGALSTSLADLAADVTGILPVNNGGTGWSSLASSAIPYGNGSSALATSSALSFDGTKLIVTYASSTAFTTSGALFAGLGQFTNTSGTTTIASGQGFTIGESQFVLQQGSGNVGIGTASPFTNLHVVGNIAAYTSAQTSAGSPVGASIYLGDGGWISSNYTTAPGISAIYNSTYGVAGDLAFYRYNGSRSEAMRIASSGNVGIGTTTPWGKLSITGTGTGTGLGFVFADSANNPKFVIQDNGSVGIGTTNPWAMLSIAGGFAANASSTIGNGTQGGGLTVNGGATTTLPLNVGSTLYVNDTSATSFRLQTRLNVSAFPIPNVSPSATNTVVAFDVMPNGTPTEQVNNGFAWIDVCDGDFNYNANVASTCARTGVRSDYVEFSSRSFNGGTVKPIVFNLGQAGSNIFEAMRITSTGNVGIGTTTPAAKLEVLETGSNNVRGMANIQVSDDTSAPLFKFYKARGTVTAPTAVLSGDVLGNFSFGGYDGSTAWGPSSDTLGVRFRAVSQENWSSTAHGTDLVFETVPKTTTSVTERLRITSEGNVGIGTTTPDKLLSVGDSSTGGIFAQVRNSNTGTGAFADVSTANGYSILDALALQTAGTGFTTAGAFVQDSGILQARSGLSGGLSILTAASAPIRFYTGGSADSNERLRIDSSGNVGIGTTAPNALLDLGNALNTIKLAIWDNNNPSTMYGIGTQVYDSVGALTFGAGVTATGTPQMVVLSNGNVGIGTTTPTAQLSTTGTVRFSNFGAGTLTTDASGNLSVSSDERLKNIDGAFARGLSDILKLNPISYHWNATSGLDTSTQYAGFSAQNVQQAIPEAVGSSASGYLTLQDRPLIATVVNAVKEIAQQVGNLAERVVTKEIIATNGNFRRVNTGELCIDDICVTREQFAAMVAAAGQSAGSSSPTPSGTLQAPVIELNGNATSTIEIGDTYNDLGARIVAPDSDLNLGIVILLDGATTTTVSIDTAQPSEHTILYTVTDPQGLTGSAARTVIVSPADPVPQPANDNASSTPAVIGM